MHLLQNSHENFAPATTEHFSNAVGQVNELFTLNIPRPQERFVSASAIICTGTFEKSETPPLTVREVAQRLNVSMGLVYALCSSGRLEHRRFGTGRGTIRINVEWIEWYEQRSRRWHLSRQQTMPRRAVFKHLDSQRLAAAWASRGVKLPAQPPSPDASVPPPDADTP